MEKRGQGDGSIYKRPDGLWCGRITLGKDADGKQKRKAFYGKTRQEVQKKITSALTQLSKGTYIEPSKITLRQWMSDWLQEYKKPAVKHTTYSNLKKYEKRIIPILGHYPLKDLRNDMVQSLANQLHEKGYCPSETKRTIGMLYSCLEQAVRNDMLRKNVATNVILPQMPRLTRAVLTQEEQERFIEASKDFFFGPVFILMLATGLRLGEALALTWDDINFDKSDLTVNKTQTIFRDYDDPDGDGRLGTHSPKTLHSYRTVPLLPPIADMLQAIKKSQDTPSPLRMQKWSQKVAQLPAGVRNQVEAMIRDPDTTHQSISEWLATQGFDINKAALMKYAMRIKEAEKNDYSQVPSYERYVFCSRPGTMWYCSNVERGFRRLIKQLGMRSELTPHRLRHTFATRGLESGVPLKVMQELLGQASLQITADLYTHVLPDLKKDSIMKMEDTIQL